MTAKSLTFLLDRDDLTCVEARCPRALAGVVLAFDTDIHVHLLQRGIGHITPWDIIGSNEWGEAKAYEAAIQRHWSTYARMEFEGIDLLNMAAFRHIAAFSRLAWAAYTIRRALEHLQPAVVYTFDERGGHGLDQPVDYRKMPLLFGLLRGMAEQRGVSVQLISRGAEWETSRFEDRIAKRNTHVHPPVDAEAALGSTPFLLFQGNHADLLRQLPLIAAIRGRTQWEVVQLYKDADAEVVRRVRNCGHLFWHESQVACADPAPDVASLARAARRRFDAAGRAAAGELRAVFDNPHVASHFAFLFGEYAQKMAAHVRAWKAFFARCRPAAFVANYHAPIYDVAAAVGIPCLGLAHGWMMMGRSKWFASLPESSLMGAISALHRGKLVRAGVSRDRIRITGDPRHDQLFAEVRALEERPAFADTLRKRLGIGPDQRMILLCTANLGMASKTSHLPLVDWAAGVRSLHALASLARRRSDRVFVVKCHPRFDHPDLYAELNRGLPPDRRFMIAGDEPLLLLAGAADAICMWNCVSSALVEVSFAQKPVMVFAQALVWYGAEQWGCETWPHVNDMGEFETELDAIFSDPQHYGGRVDQTLRAARRFVGDTDPSAIARCVRVLSDMARSTVPVRMCATRESIAGEPVRTSAGR